MWGPIRLEKAEGKLLLCALLQHLLDALSECRVEVREVSVAKIWVGHLGALFLELRRHPREVRQG